MNEKAIKLYEQAQADYPKLKAQIEAQVVRWFWAAGGVGYFSLEPFYFEKIPCSAQETLRPTLSYRPKYCPTDSQYLIRSRV